ncbi:YadA-like family protein [Variovorax sp. PAMC26660]|uniref:YadA-like family protein n=1 Tax=Variovorax sp. PAMC26660 TaxID=2762322 RepID=UPI00164EB065|nr:YadA-like family protein [Variovorax sp. PAMC26660]QNK67160.1 YadA-like family protein [Variovorax sp. PAMC26660]
MTVAEKIRARDRRGTSRATIAAAATFLGAANMAWAGLSVNDGSLCLAQSGPPQTWTCQVPNRTGGFAIIQGLPDDGSGASPNWPAVATAAATQLGAGALLIGNTATVATAPGSIAVGNGAKATAANALALGNNAVATAANGVALGANSTADRVGMAGQKELFSNTVVNSTQGAVSVGSAGNERQITNVAGGTQATDAVNVRQLQAVQQSAVRYDTNVDGSINHNSVTMGNGGSTGPVAVHNVAPGVAPTDAVNVQQLQSSAASTTAYTDARVNQLGQSIDDIGKKAYAGVAAALAMESAPYIPGKVTYAAGMGHYERQTAVGVSLRKTADSGRWSVTGGASATGRGTLALRVGIGGVWD